MANKSLEISISEKDFPGFDSNFDNAPATFSVMIQLVNDENKIAIDSSGGTSAAKLLGRFCNVNQSIHKLTNEKIEKEIVRLYNLATMAVMPHSRHNLI